MDFSPIIESIEITLEELKDKVSIIEAQLNNLREQLEKAAVPEPEPEPEEPAPVAVAVPEPEFAPEPEPVPEPEFDPAPAVEPEPIQEEGPADFSDVEDLLDEAAPVEDLPEEPVAEAEKPVEVTPVEEVKPRVLTYQWQKDMPGLPVKDIRSAIALNDRVLFINTLFGQDPILFQDTLSALNAIESLPEAEEYVSGHFPQWDLSSEVAYRFMMAVRRKLR